MQPTPQLLPVLVVVRVLVGALALVAGRLHWNRRCGSRVVGRAQVGRAAEHRACTSGYPHRSLPPLPRSSDRKNGSYTRQRSRRELNLQARLPKYLAARVVVMEKRPQPDPGHGPLWAGRSHGAVPLDPRGSRSGPPAVSSLASQDMGENRLLPQRTVAGNAASAASAAEPLCSSASGLLRLGLLPRQRQP